LGFSNTIAWLADGKMDLALLDLLNLFLKLRMHPE
jgi:hypothetical protein